MFDVNININMNMIDNINININCIVHMAGSRLVSKTSGGDATLYVGMAMPCFVVL